MTATSSSWQYVTTTIRMNTAHSSLRIQVSMNNVGVDYDIDNVTVWGPY